MADTTPPRTVRAAGVLVGLQGLAGAVFTVALLVRVLLGTQHTGDVLGEAGYYAVIAAAVLAAGIGLLLGKHWARTPAAVVQLLLLGVAWYAIGPSQRFTIGVPLAVLCVAVLVLLFSRSGRTWSIHASTAPDATDTEDTPTG